jgi:hypothetical protein
MPVLGQVLERERPISLLAAGTSPPPLRHDNRVEINGAQSSSRSQGTCDPPLSLSFHDFMLLALVASSPLLQMGGFGVVRELGG